MKSKGTIFATSLKEVAQESPCSIRFAKLQGKPHGVYVPGGACPEPSSGSGLTALTGPPRRTGRSRVFRSVAGPTTGWQKFILTGV